MRDLPSVIARQLQNAGPDLRKNTYAGFRYTDPIEAHRDMSNIIHFPVQTAWQLWRTASLACDSVSSLRCLQPAKAGL
jgi:hypothetical protein